MMFQQTPAQQAGLDRLLASQRDPSSPDYHKWLTPEQYADRFGLSTDDLARVTAWLKSAGFTIESTARGRDWVVFSGTAAQVESALHTSVHRYAIGAQTHVAIATEPVLPADLKPLVGTILGLNDFHPKSMWKPGYTSGSGYTLAPGDLATIYDINGLYQQGFDGSGQKIAVVGQAAVQMADIQQFRTSYGLGPAKITMVQNGTPWVDQADMIEADLDLEWAGAIAPNAMLIYVYGADADSAAFMPSIRTWPR
jgi:subtilase family serine protease